MTRYLAIAAIVAILLLGYAGASEEEVRDQGQGQGQGQGGQGQGGCNSINQQAWTQMRTCAVTYWTSQVFPRSQAKDTIVLNCFNPNVRALPFSAQVAEGKDQVADGWSRVSTSDAAGPYFENNTALQIIEVFSGCNETNDTPYVTVNMVRHFHFWATGEDSQTPYMSTFTFVKSSNQHRDPSVGAPDYTIIQLRYHPYATPINRLWPGVPIQPDIYSQFYSCEMLRLRCPNINWAPQDNCFAWMQNHPMTLNNYSPVLQTGTQSCVYYTAFFGTTQNPTNDPTRNLCIVFDFVCTGNIPAGRRRSANEQDKKNIDRLIKAGAIHRLAGYLDSM